ncbi:MAG: cardiolipin synthase B, partial [Phycisphaerae bacterium]|nr:cardiolipin synthase B [Gemmatimonadaceae bacterium]
MVIPTRCGRCSTFLAQPRTQPLRTGEQLSGRTFLIALSSSALTLVVVLAVSNLKGSEKKIERRLERLYSIDDPQFRRSMDHLLGPPVLDGNHVEVLVNGDRIFPAMLEAIRGAQKTITFETFIYWSGSIGQEFVEALSERARAGVKTHVMLDFVGSIKMELQSIEAMRSAGVEVQRYHKPVWWHLGRLNNRTHRKTLVVDGTIGFTGGVGIADNWRGNAQDPEHWRDTHFRVQGPVVAQMQSVFIDNWIQSTGRVLHGPLYFPPLEGSGDMDAQMFRSSPTGGSESMQLMYLMAITAAERTIHLSSAYFVPDKLATMALAAAAKRGVDVRIIVPGTNIDTEIVRKASRGLWGPLLEAGVMIAEFQPTMFHVKALVVDSRMVSVGSTNFDNRSFSINDEANLNVFNQAFAEEQELIFEADWKLSR